MNKLCAKVISGIYVVAFILAMAGIKEADAATCPPHGATTQIWDGASHWEEQHLVKVGETENGDFLYMYCTVSVTCDHIVGICQRCGETIQKYDRYTKHHQQCGKVEEPYYV